MGSLAGLCSGLVARQPGKCCKESPCMLCGMLKMQHHPLCSLFFGQKAEFEGTGRQEELAICPLEEAWSPSLLGSDGPCFLGPAAPSPFASSIHSSREEKENKTLKITGSILKRETLRCHHHPPLLLPPFLRAPGHMSASYNTARHMVPVRHRTPSGQKGNPHQWDAPHGTATSSEGGRGDCSSDMKKG